MIIKFINNVNKAEMFRLDGAMFHVPSVGVHIVNERVEWVVEGTLIDYDTHDVNVFIRKAASYDVNYMKQH